MILKKVYILQKKTADIISLFCIHLSKTFKILLSEKIYKFIGL
jgi:hypothetical protein